MPSDSARATSHLRRNDLGRMEDRVEMTRGLMALPPSDAVGAAVAFLLHMVDTNPHVLKQVFLMPIDKPGRPPGTVIDIFNRVSRG